MPDVNGGLAFARGLLETALPYHEQLQKRDRDEEERQRTGMLSILSAAMQSNSLDPQAYPILLERALELQGAKGKDVKRYGNAFRSLLSQGYEATGTKITGYDTRPAADNSNAEGPYVSEPSNAPLADFNAKIHKPLFQSPEAVAQREANVEATKQRALLPVKKELIQADTEHDLAVEAAKARVREAEQKRKSEDQIARVTKAYDLKAGLKVRERANEILNAGLADDIETATRMAAGEAYQDRQRQREYLKAKIGLTTTTSEAIKKRLFYEGERVAQGWERVNQGWDSLDLREQGLALEEAYRQALVEMQGNTKRQQDYAAQARPLLDQIRQTESQRASLERMVASGLAVGDNVSGQVEAYRSRLTGLRDDLQKLTNTYTGSLETPKFEPKAVARGGRGSRYVAPKVSKEQLDKLLQ